MSDRDDAVPELSAEADAAWRAFAGSIAPDGDAQARVLDRVRARVQRSRRAESTDEDAQPTPLRRAAAAVLVMKSSAISVGLAGGTLLSIKLIAAALRPSAPAPEPPAVVIPEPPSATQPVAHAPPRAPAPPQPLVAPPSVEASPALPPEVQRPVRVAAPSSPPEDPLQAEVELMGRMRAAVQAGQHARVLELAADHRTRFPAGSFVEERDAFAAIAACRNGDANGPALARTFASARPKSVQLAAVRAACDATANEPTDPSGRQQ